jgi:hypothetical protein
MRALQNVPSILHRGIFDRDQQVSPASSEHAATGAVHARGSSQPR